jgi:hypothetical protein
VVEEFIKYDHQPARLRGQFQSGEGGRRHVFASQ